MRRILAILALISGVGLAADGPKARIARYLDRGGSEGLELSCAAECTLQKFSGETILSTRKIDAKLAGEIVEGFLRDLPKSEVKKLSLPEPQLPAGPILSWYVVKDGRYAEGALTRQQMDKSLEPPALEAVLSLEGRLAREGRRR